MRTEYALSVQQYCTAVAGVLHYTRSLAWVALCSRIMHDDEAWHARITLPHDPLLGSTTLRRHTCMSKETGLVLDLGWTSSQPSHLRCLIGKGKHHECFSRNFLTWKMPNKRYFMTFKYTYTYRRDWLHTCNCSAHIIIQRVTAYVYMYSVAFPYIHSYR